jgi:hypothetical protein
VNGIRHQRRKVPHQRIGSFLPASFREGGETGEVCKQNGRLAAFAWCATIRTELRLIIQCRTFIGSFAPVLRAGAALTRPMPPSDTKWIEMAIPGALLVSRSVAANVQGD